jgi:hypothetical protein
MPGHRSKVDNFKLNKCKIERRRSSFIAFLACLEFVVLNSAYHNNILCWSRSKFFVWKVFIYLFNFARLNYTIDKIVQTSTNKSHNLNIQISSSWVLHQNNCAGLSNNTVETNVPLKCPYTYIIYLTKDVICILPTGYGKSLISIWPHALMMFARDHIKQVNFLFPWKSLGISTQDVSCIVIVVSPLNSLIQDQISRLKASGLRAFASRLPFYKYSQRNIQRRNHNWYAYFRFWL